MVKLFGYRLGGKQNATSMGIQQQHHRRRKNRQSPSSNLTPEILRERYPMYQYALDEFSQTLPPGTSNSDGIEVYRDQTQKQMTPRLSGTSTAAATPTIGNKRSSTVFLPTNPNEEGSLDTQSKQHHAQHDDIEINSNTGSWTTVASGSHIRSIHSSQKEQIHESIKSLEVRGMEYTSANDIANQQPNQQDEWNTPRHITSSSVTVPYQIDIDARNASYSANSPLHVLPSSSRSLPPSASSAEKNDGIPCTTSNGSVIYPSFESAAAPTTGTNKSTQVTQFRAIQSPFERNVFSEATYEEFYGDAYTGGRLKYIYPSGYQSMRPRSGPWKLSIIVCMLFTWLSVFIVGHCSDQVSVDGGSSSNNNDNDSTSNANSSMQGEDIYQWCGSRPLYLMWFISMLITFLSAAYCSIIGYIKIRDFAVANSRSQPPGVIDGKSDYYVRIHDVQQPIPSGTDANNNNDGATTIAYHLKRTMTQESSTVTSPYSYHPTIYQSDGAPQFWGYHIYRPTQAAVAISNRD